MRSTMCIFLVAVAAVALLAPTGAQAYSAQLFESSNCSPSTVLAYKTKLESGSCVVVGNNGIGSSAKVSAVSILQPRT